MGYEVYKYRIYPSKEQIKKIQNTFVSCNFVYNYMLIYKKRKYRDEGIILSRIDCNNFCTRYLKKEYPWLKDVDKCALTYACFNVDAAFSNYYNKDAGFPKKKSRSQNYKSYTTDCNNNSIKVNFAEKYIQMPKLKKIKAKLHREFNGTIKRATLICTPTEKYFISIYVETEHKSIAVNDNTIGLDLGVKNICTTSNGNVYPNPQIGEEYQYQINKLRTKLKRQVKGSNNYEKTRKLLAKYYEKINNKRNDYINKLTYDIVKSNKLIAVENLEITHMVKNHNLSTAILNVGMYEILRQLEYKCDWYGRYFVKVDRYFPSTRICSSCGYINKDITLGIREWDCPNCGTHHDRDENAAKNILKEGIRLLKVANN